MQPPKMVQFRYHTTKDVNVGLFKKKIITKRYFDKRQSEVRTFTDEFNKKLVEHFTHNPPKVGDLFYIEGCFRIIKVFYNFNHDQYVIWYFHDVNADMENVEYSG